MWLVSKAPPLLMAETLFQIMQNDLIGFTFSPVNFVGHHSKPMQCKPVLKLIKRDIGSHEHRQMLLNDPMLRLLRPLPGEWQ